LGGFFYGENKMENIETAVTAEATTIKTDVETAETAVTAEATTIKTDVETEVKNEETGIVATIEADIKKIESWFAKNL
jgi:hypothetical protein